MPEAEISDSQFAPSWVNGHKANGFVNGRVAGHPMPNGYFDTDADEIDGESTPVPRPPISRIVANNTGTPIYIFFPAF